jgi:hypothetical protein
MSIHLAAECFKVKGFLGCHSNLEYSVICIAAAAGRQCARLELTGRPDDRSKLDNGTPELGNHRCQEQLPFRRFNDLWMKLLATNVLVLVQRFFRPTAIFARILIP